LNMNRELTKHNLPWIESVHFEERVLTTNLA
jgi:hypothetical protein